MPRGATLSTDVGSQGYTWKPLSNQTTPGISLPANARDPFALAYDPLQGTIWVGMGLGTINFPYFFTFYPAPVVDVVNATTDRVVRTITVSPFVSAIAFDPADGDMYLAVPVLDSYSNATLIVLNGTTDEVAHAPIPVGVMPTDILYVPSTRDLWVSDTSSQDIDVVSSANNSVVAQISGANSFTEPWGLAFDPVNGCVYVASITGSSIYAVNVTNQTALGFEIRTPGDYGGILYDAESGDLYAYGLGFWSYGAGLEVIDPFTEAPIASIPMPGGNLPDAVVEDPDSGNLWVSVQNESGVTVNVSTQTVEPGGWTAGVDPWNAILDPENRVAFFANSNQSEIVPVNLTDPASSPPAIALAVEPDAGVFDPTSGVAYLTDPSGPGILRIDPFDGDGAGSEVRLGALGLGIGPSIVPGAIAFDPDTNELLVAEVGASGLWVLNASTATPAGGPLAIPGPATALAFDPDSGGVLVGFQNGSLGRLDPVDGALAALATLPGAPSSIQPDPENGLAWVSGSTNASACSGFVDAVVPTNGSIVFSARLPYALGPATLDPDNAVFYVPGAPCVGNSLVLAFDARNGTSEPGPNTGLSNPASVAFDGYNGELYAGDAYLGQIGAVNGSTNQSVSAPGTVLPATGPSAFLLPIPADGAVLGLDPVDGAVDAITLRPTIVSATLVPDPVDAGAPFSANVTAGGGAGNLTYAYSGLPSDCGTPTTARFTCTSAEPGSYSVAAVVTDQAGANTSVARTLLVEPRLTVMVTASTAHTVPGDSVSFTALGAGGVAPYRFMWALGDGAAGIGATLSHAYTRAAPYSVQVTATDALGLVANASVSVVVGPSFTAAILASPTQLGPGQPLTVNVSAAGGVAPYVVQVLFGDLTIASLPFPAGASSVWLDHGYATAGAFVLRAWVNDSHGGTDNATFLIDVAGAAPPPASPQTATGTTPEPWLLPLFVGDGAAAAVLATLLWLRRRDRRSPPTGGQPTRFDP